MKQSQPAAKRPGLCSIDYNTVLVGKHDPIPKKTAASHGIGLERKPSEGSTLGSLSSILIKTRRRSPLHPPHFEDMHDDGIPSSQVNVSESKLKQPDEPVFLKEQQDETVVKHEPDEPVVVKDEPHEPVVVKDEPDEPPVVVFDEPDEPVVVVNEYGEKCSSQDDVLVHLERKH